MTFQMEDTRGPAKMESAHCSSALQPKLSDQMSHQRNNLASPDSIHTAHLAPADSILPTELMSLHSMVGRTQTHEHTSQQPGSGSEHASTHRNDSSTDVRHDSSTNARHDSSTHSRPSEHTGSAHEQTHANSDRSHHQDHVAHTPDRGEGLLMMPLKLAMAGLSGADDETKEFIDKTTKQLSTAFFNMKHLDYASMTAFGDICTDMTGLFDRIGMAAKSGGRIPEQDLRNFEKKIGEDIEKFCKLRPEESARQIGKLVFKIAEHFLDKSADKSELQEFFEHLGSGIDRTRAIGRQGTHSDHHYYPNISESEPSAYKLPHLQITGHH